MKLSPSEVINRGRKARAILTDETVLAYWAGEESNAISRLIAAKTDIERIDILAEIKAHRGIKRNLELAQLAGANEEKKEARNAR